MKTDLEKVTDAVRSQLNDRSLVIESARREGDDVTIFTHSPQTNARTKVLLKHSDLTEIADGAKYNTMSAELAARKSKAVESGTKPAEVGRP